MSKVKKAIITILIIAALCGMCRGAWLMGYNAAVSKSRALDTMKMSVRLLDVASYANTIARNESLPQDTRGLATQISDEMTDLLKMLGW